MAKKTKPGASVPVKAVQPAAALLDDIRALIQAARVRTAHAVNAGLVGLYWGVGDRIRREVLKEKRAEYGAEIVRALSGQLTAEFGPGFAEKGRRRMIQFTETFPDAKIVAALSRQLGWSHFVELLGLEAGGIRVAEYLTELPPARCWNASFSMRQGSLADDSGTGRRTTWG